MTSEYWENFKRDGKLFERLSKVLIEYEYHQENFYIVGGPGDGGKDILKDISFLGGYRSQIWAQCKFYHETLSFDDISYTLLMAYLKNTNQILIFSYSKVSDTFGENLNEYIARTAKNVVLYADEDLERLILRHRARLGDEHPEFFPAFPKDLPDEAGRFQTDYQIYIDSNRISSAETTVSINSICELVLTVTNRSSLTREIALEQVENRAAKAFDFLDDGTAMKRTVPPDHSVTFKIHVRLKRATGRTFFPCFMIRFGGETEKIFTRKRLNCRWLADVPLIGEKYRDALGKIVQGLQYPHFHLVYIRGKSGMGKSRLIKETQTFCVKSGKRMVYIDSEKKDLSCKKFVTLLCAKMTGLPIFHEPVSVIADTGEITLEYAARILYDDTFDIAREWENTAKLFAQLMTNENIVVALDNLQHYDKLSLQIVEQLIVYLKNTACGSDILLGINLDYVYENSIFGEFLYRLQCSAGNNPDFYTGILLEGLDRRASELYIRECLSFHSGDATVTELEYEQAIGKMAEHCGTNPFYIQQYLLYLDQQGILRRSENTLYYFSDVAGFLNSFHKIPERIESLIAERERLFLSKETSECAEKYRRTIYLINLTKSLPETIYYDIIGDQALLLSLLDMGFLTLVDGGIVPIHSYYSLFYGTQYAVEGAPRGLLERFVASAERFEGGKAFALPALWAKSRLDMADVSDLQRVAAQIDSWNFDCSAFRYCLKAAAAMADKYAWELGADGYLRLYNNICVKLDESVSIVESAYFYEKFLTAFLEKSEWYAGCADPAISLITNGLIHLVNLEQYEKCLRAVDALTQISTRFPEQERLRLIYETNRCKIMVFNRSDAVTEAIDAADDNLRILLKEETSPSFRNKMLFSAMRSVGNTYFYSTVAYENRQKIVESWSSSFELFVQKHGMELTDGYADQPKIAAFAKGLGADIIAEREAQAEKKAVFFENAFDKMHMMYYEMQIRLLMAIYLTWKWSGPKAYTTHMDEIERYIGQTLDIAALYGRKLTTINAFHLRAVAYYLAGNDELALDNYRIVADLLTKYLKTDRDFNRWEYVWVDYARALRRLGKSAPHEFELRCGKRMQSVIRKICAMPDRDYSDYEEAYVPMTAMTDKSRSINFPKI